MSGTALHGIYADWTTTVLLRVPGEDAQDAEERLGRLLESPGGLRAVQLEYAANALDEDGLSGAVELTASGDVEPPEDGAPGGGVGFGALLERERRAELALSGKVSEMRFGDIVARRSGFLGPDGRPGLRIGCYGRDGRFKLIAVVEEDPDADGGIAFRAWQDERCDEPCVSMRWNGEKPESAGR